MPINLIKKFIHLEAASGIILFITALLAILIDNSPFSHYYEYFLEASINIELGSFIFKTHIPHIINDGLMVIFFLLVGLEIKRELIEGELNSPSKVLLPLIAALGGMLVPAVIFSLINHQNDFAMRGWAIPTATDIAFSLGILSLLGKRVPASLKVFLMALAIFDDLGAIIIIALFYNTKISFICLSMALATIILLLGLNRLKVRAISIYLIFGFFLWLFLLYSGIHATLAGVILALTIPLKTNKINEISPAKYLIQKIHPWVAFLILPIFAFTNAGISLNDIPGGLENILSPVMLGIALGLFLGKTIGVFTTTFLSIYFGFVKKPNQASFIQIFGLALVCGVGFTMSFFVGSLAYPADITMGHYGAWVRLGVLAGSLLSGFMGFIVLFFAARKIKT